MEHVRFKKIIKNSKFIAIRIKNLERVLKQVHSDFSSNFSHKFSLLFLRIASMTKPKTANRKRNFETKISVE